MDSIEELRARLLAEEQRAERLEKEKQQAEAEKQQAEAEKQQAEAEKQQAEAETRNTTLFEYLRALHELVFIRFTVETDKKTTSKGSLTNPAGRWCPPRLEPWKGFLEEQRGILGEVFSACPNTRVFSSRHYLKARGEVIGKKRVGDEDTLKEIMDDLLAEPVKSIVERLQDGVDIGFNIRGGIAFKSRLNALGEESAQWPRTPSGKRPRPDQICAYRDDEDSTRRTVAYFIEYKAPHKLTPPHLRLGLRPMNIYSDVVNRPTIPTEKAARFQYHADRLAAIAVTQVFDDMVRAGLTYGCLTTGEAYVFLKVDWADMALYYHLAEPGPEVDAHSDNPLCCTAVSQVLAFTLNALDSQTYHGQDDRKRAIESLNKWEEDWESILRSIPQSERVAPPDSPAYRPTTYSGVDRSPYKLRLTKDRAGRAECKGGPSGRDPSPEASDDGSGGTEMPGTPSPAQPRARRGPARRPRGKKGDNSRGALSTHRRYCSHKCLLGLVDGSDLDDQCPNAALHRSKTTDRRHPVDHENWLRLLREQLRETLDDGVVRLGKQGARGVVFQVTLLRYGYTFIAKAAGAGCVSELKHEGDIYGHLRSLQGVRIPVFLGAVDLRRLGRTYYYESCESEVNITHLVHFMFLSQGGSSLDEVEVSDRAKVKQEVVSSVQAIHKCGVVHTDVRNANVLWDGERVMLIDFEQAKWLKPLAVGPTRRALAHVVPNKRPWRAEATGSETTGKRLKSTGDPRILKDIIEAEGIFD